MENNNLLEEEQDWGRTGKEGKDKEDKRDDGR